MYLYFAYCYCGLFKEILELPCFKETDLFYLLHFTPKVLPHFIFMHVMCDYSADQNVPLSVFQIGHVPGCPGVHGSFSMVVLDCLALHYRMTVNCKLQVMMKNLSKLLSALFIESNS